LLPKKDEITLGVIFGCFLVGYIHDLPPSSLIDYEPLMPSIAKTSTIYVVISSTCSNSTCHFIRPIPKDLLYAIILFSLLSSSQSKQDG
jgi:hypothetical protein